MISSRFDSEKAGDREVQRTMLELLNQLDGFQPNTQVKVILPLVKNMRRNEASRYCRITWGIVSVYEVLINSTACEIKPLHCC